MSGAGFERLHGGRERLADGLRRARAWEDEVIAGRSAMAARIAQLAGA